MDRIDGKTNKILEKLNRAYKRPNLEGRRRRSRSLFSPPPPAASLLREERSPSFSSPQGKKLGERKKASPPPPFFGSLLSSPQAYFWHLAALSRSVPFLFFPLSSLRQPDEEQHHFSTCVTHTHTCWSFKNMLKRESKSSHSSEQIEHHTEKKRRGEGRLQEEKLPTFPFLLGKEEEEDALFLSHQRNPLSPASSSSKRREFSHISPPTFDFYGNNSHSL